MCEHVYTENILERFKMPEENPATMPCDRSSGVTEDSLGSHVPCRAVLGCLRYLMTATRSDISLVVSRTGRAVDRPTEADWTDVKRVLKYLRGTSYCGLLYGAVTAGNVRSVRRLQNKTAKERRGGCVCRLCNYMFQPTKTVVRFVKKRKRICCS